MFIIFSAEKFDVNFPDSTGYPIDFFPGIWETWETSMDQPWIVYREMYNPNVPCWAWNIDKDEHNKIELSFENSWHKE